MIYIILVNWNGINDTLACLDSLLKLNCDNFSIVVCDNGSSDNSSLKIQEWFCSLENEQRNKCNLHKVSEKQLDKKFDKNKNLNIYFIDIGKNLGFSGGNNVGIKFSLSQGDMDYVWLLNNDTVVDSNSLSIMKSAFSRNENIGICGSK